MSITIHKYGDKRNPAILFLHGAGVSSWMWIDQVEALSKTYYCLAVDMPGSGESHREEWVSFDETAGRLAEIIKTETSNQKAHVVGLSLGGYATLILLSRYPDLVRSAIVSGVTPMPFPNQWLYRRLVQVSSGILKWDVMIKLNMRLMQIPQEVAHLYRRDSKNMSREMLKRIYAEVLPFELPANLSDLNPRLLSVAGEKEARLIVNGLSHFDQIGSNVVTALAPNAHHGWNGEHPELFTEMIEAWIENDPLPSALILNSEYKQPKAVSF